jgi:hypothetical protein
MAVLCRFSMSGSQPFSRPRLKRVRPESSDTDTSKMEFMMEFIGKGWRNITVDCWGSNTIKIVRTLFKHFQILFIFHVVICFPGCWFQSTKIFFVMAWNHRLDKRITENLLRWLPRQRGSAGWVQLLLWQYYQNLPLGKMTDIHVPLESKCRSFKCNFSKEFYDILLRLPREPPSCHGLAHADSPLRCKTGLCGLKEEQARVYFNVWAMTGAVWALGMGGMPE